MAEALSQAEPAEALTEAEGRAEGRSGLVPSNSWVPQVQVISLWFRLVRLGWVLTPELEQLYPVGSPWKPQTGKTTDQPRAEEVLETRQLACCFVSSHGTAADLHGLWRKLEERRPKSDTSEGHGSKTRLGNLQLSFN